MNDEEKRMYMIQKGKYDTYTRICLKKAEKGEHPVDRHFKYEETA